MYKRKKRIEMTMQIKITLCLYIFIIMPLIIFLLFSNFQMRKQKSDDIMQYSFMAFEQIRMRISGEIDDLLRNVYMFSYSTDFTRILNEASMEDDIGKKLLDFWYLNSYIEFYDKYNVQVFVKDYMICSRDSSRENKIVSADCLADKQWYNEQVNNNYRYYFFIEDGEDGKEINVAHRIVSDKDHSKTIGVVKFGFDSSIFTDMIGSNMATENTVNCIVDSVGNIVSSSGAVDREDLAKTISSVPYDDVINKSAYQTEDDKNIYISTAVSSTDWILLSIIPKADINKTINKTSMFWIGMAFILCLVATVAAKKIVNSISRPIQSLSNEIDFGRDKMFDIDDYPLDLKPIVTAYNNDLKRIKNLVKESYDLKQETGKYGIELLNLQIHPHFLYNALNTLHWEAKKQNCTSVEEGIESLSSFLKMSVERRGEIVSLAEEVEHVRGYMKIQNLRYEDFVSFRTEIPQEYRDVSMPCFTLQPLVENAIIHGILLKNSEMGEIVITVEESGNDVLINISDDGVGIDANKLSAINYELRDGIRETIGIGLYDVNMRLRLLFGIEYYLVLSNNAKGATVTIRVPRSYNYEIPHLKDRGDNDYA